MSDSHESINNIIKIEFPNGESVSVRRSLLLGHSLKYFLSQTKKINDNMTRLNLNLDQLVARIGDSQEIVDLNASVKGEISVIKLAFSDSVQTRTPESRRRVTIHSNRKKTEDKSKEKDKEKEKEPKEKGKRPKNHRMSSVFSKSKKEDDSENSQKEKKESGYHNKIRKRLEDIYLNSPPQSSSLPNLNLKLSETIFDSNPDISSSMSDLVSTAYNSESSEINYGVYGYSVQSSDSKEETPTVPKEPVFSWGETADNSLYDSCYSVNTDDSNPMSPIITVTSPSLNSTFVEAPVTATPIPPTRPHGPPPEGTPPRRNSSGPSQPPQPEPQSQPPQPQPQSQPQNTPSDPKTSLQSQSSPNLKYSTAYALQDSLKVLLSQNKKESMEDSKGADISSSTDGKEDKPALNERFQLIYSEFLDMSLSKKPNFEKNYDINRNFVDISKDFLFSSHSLGRLIINEVSLPDEKKTIKPESLGGFIGGAKYLSRGKGILFKFAIAGDLVTDHEVAMKIAGRELLSLNHLVECHISGVHFPLQCLIDYLGFRLVAMSFLPINKNTLKIGSCDGGKTFRYDDPQLAKLFEEIGSKLGLAVHYLHNSPVTVAADVEGHKGMDSRYYVLDLSRTFPPMQRPKSTDPSAHLYKLFRPEFVKVYKKTKPLCSDAFSRFVSNPVEQSRFDKEVEVAMDYFMKTMLAKAAKNIGKLSEATKIQGAIDVKHPFLDICVAIHREGVNLRFMRRIFEMVESPRIKSLLAIEMGFRTIKKMINRDLRTKIFESESMSELPCKEIVCNYLNKIFGRDEIWKQVNAEAFKYYEGADVELDLGELIWAYGNNKKIMSQDSDEVDGFPTGPELLFSKLQSHLGLILNKEIEKYIYRRNALQSIPKGKHLLNPQMIETIQGRVKHMHVITHAIAQQWKWSNDNRIKQAYTNTLLSKGYCSLKAAEGFDEAMQLLSSSSVTLRNAITARLDYWFEKQQSITPPQKDYIIYQFKIAQSLDPSDPVTNTVFHEAMKKLGDFKMAEEVLLSFLEKQNRQDPVKKREYIAFLLKMNRKEDADYFEELTTKDANKKTLHN